MTNETTINQNHHEVLQRDIMRYKTNKFSSNFTLGGVAFGCLYFLVLYGQYTMAYESQNGGDLYYNVTMGLSVLYNLVFLLLAVFESIQVKNYRKSAPYILIALAIIQIGRIFWFPLDGHNALNTDGSTVVPDSSFAYMIVWLILSAACLIAAAVWGIIRNGQYYSYKAKLENGEVDVDESLKAVEAEEAANLAAAPAETVKEE